MKITLTEYLMGREKIFPLQMTPALRDEAERTVDLVNKLLDRAALFGVTLELVAPPRPGAGTLVASGWRPPAINAGTIGAAPNSKHMTCKACDINDSDGDLDAWLMTDAGQAALKEIGLWMEHPSATKGWSHLQTTPPNSGNRVFYP